MNFKIVDGQSVKTSRFATKANTTAIAVGDLVILGKTNAGYAEFCPATAVLTDFILGIATSAGTHTASANGVVEVAYSFAGMEVEGKVTTASNLARALVGTHVVLDVSSSVQTVDENDTTKGFIIIAENPDGRFDTTNGIQRFIIRAGVGVVDTTS